VQDGSGAEEVTAATEHCITRMNKKYMRLSTKAEVMILVYLGPEVYIIPVKV